MHKMAYPLHKANEDNMQFDEHLKEFLRDWLTKGSPDNAELESQGLAIEEFVNSGALREYFRRHDAPFHKLLEHGPIAKHLCRPHHQVYFDPVTNDPALSQFECRIYNLSAHRQHLQIPYRFIPLSRQGCYGDVATLDELPEDRKGKDKDIGDYFSTRRADETAVKTMHGELKRTIKVSKQNVRLIDVHYMQDALTSVLQEMLLANQTGKQGLHFFVLQCRYRPEGIDRHFGAALLIINADRPNNPERIIFCDTVHLPGWRPLFGNMIAAVFGEASEELIEVASHPLQGLNREANVADHDINCSLYTRSMARALLLLAQKQPQFLLEATIEQIHQTMKCKMPDYYKRNGDAKPPAIIKRTNLHKRWNLGHSMMLHLLHPAQFKTKKGRYHNNMVLANS